MLAADHLSQNVGVRRACQTLGVARASFYRQRQQQEGKPLAEKPPRSPSPRALSGPERQEVKDLLYGEQGRQRGGFSARIT